MSKMCPVSNFIERVSYWSEIADKDTSDNLVVNGSYCSIKVENNALVVQPGKLCEQSREPKIYYRGKVPFERLVILSRHGNISLDVLHWLRDQNVSLLVLDWKGDVILSSYPEPASNPVLRRLQYTLSAEKCTRIACAIIRRKIISQLEIVKRHPELNDRERVIDLLYCGTIELKDPDWRFQDVEYLRMYEARLAKSYFQSFEGLPIKWYRTDQKVIPSHWKIVTCRTSDISPNGNARKAINPFHSVLNYSYGVAESQLLGYILAAGLDPSCGVLHADNNYRDSLLWDLIEPHRAEVDAKVLDFFSKISLRKGDVAMLPTGEISINPELSRHIVASVGIDNSKLRDTVRWFKERLTT